MTTFLRAEAGVDHAPTPPKTTSRPDVFGQQLRRARQKLNLSIEEIAERIKLDPRQVAALEEERFDDLPGTAFVRGFTRQYARVLNIDEAPLLNLLPTPAARIHSTASHLGVLPRSKGLESRRRHRTAKILISLLLGIGLVSGGIIMLRTHIPSAPSSATSITPPPVISQHTTQPSTVIETNVPKSEINPQPTTSPSISLPNTTEPAPAPHAIEAQPTPSSDTPIVTTNVPTKSNGHLKVKASASLPPLIELSFEERSWVEIKDAQGRLLLSQINQPGSRQSVKGTPPYDVTLGNPRAVSIQFKGVALDVRPYTDHDTARFTLD